MSLEGLTQRIQVLTLNQEPIGLRFVHEMMDTKEGKLIQKAYDVAIIDALEGVLADVKASPFTDILPLIEVGSEFKTQVEIDNPHYPVEELSDSFAIASLLNKRMYRGKPSAEFTHFTPTVQQFQTIKNPHGLAIMIMHVGVGADGELYFDLNLQTDRIETLKLPADVVSTLTDNNVFTYNVVLTKAQLAQLCHGQLPYVYIPSSLVISNEKAKSRTHINFTDTRERIKPAYTLSMRQDEFNNHTAQGVEQVIYSLSVLRDAGYLVSIGG